LRSNCFEILEDLDLAMASSSVCSEMMNIFFWKAPTKSVGTFRL
jgi:hypothetical protein